MNSCTTIPPSDNRGCPKCGEAIDPSEFAKNTSRGKPIVTLCKLCVAEQAKLSFREKRFPLFVAELSGWPDIKLISEVAWLEAKLLAIRNELKSR